MATLIAIVAGRGAAPFVLRFFSDNALLLNGLVVLLAGIGVLLAAEDLRVLQAGAAIAGLGSSAIFPTNMWRFIKIFGDEKRRRGERRRFSSPAVWAEL